MKLFSKFVRSSSKSSQFDQINYNKDNEDNEESEDNEDNEENRTKSDIDSNSSQISQTISKSISNNISPVFNLPITVWKGSLLWKIPFKGNELAEQRFVRIKRAPLNGDHAMPIRVISRERTLDQLSFIVFPPTIVWSNPEKVDDVNNGRELVLDGPIDILEGYESKAFQKGLNKNFPLPPEPYCFSIVTSTRTVDFASESLEDAIIWKKCLLDLAKVAKVYIPSKPIKTKQTLQYSHSLPSTKSQNNNNINNNNNNFLKEKKKELKKDKQIQRNEQRDRLFNAVINNNSKEVEEILRYEGVSVHQMNSNHKTPLMVACECNFGIITRICLQYGARVDEFPEPAQTALHSASLGRSFNCMADLIKTLNQEESLERAKRIINRRDFDGNTPLHISSHYGDVHIIELLTSNGANIFIEDNFGRNSLHICSKNGFHRPLTILLNNGGDEYLDNIDNRGYTPLHYCSKEGHYECVELLLGYDVDQLKLTRNGKTSYELAKENNHLDICNLLKNYQQQQQQQQQESEQELSNNEQINNLRENNSKYYQNNLSASKAVELSMNNNNNNNEFNRSSIDKSIRTQQLELLDNGLISMQSLSLLNSNNSNNFRDFYNEQSNYNNNDNSNNNGYENNINNNYNYDYDYNNSHSQEELYQNNFINEQEYPNIDGNSDVNVCIDPSVPLEEFFYDGVTWYTYQTEEGYYYYLDGETYHSQWFDPRIEGRVVDQGQEYQQEQIEEFEDEDDDDKNKTDISPQLSQSNVVYLSPNRSYNKKDNNDNDDNDNVNEGVKTTPNLIERKFTKPRIHSPFQPTSPLPPNLCKTPNEKRIKELQHPRSAGKEAWIEQTDSTIHTSPKQQNSSKKDLNGTNCFSPDRSSVLRAKNLQKNVPFPLSSPPSLLKAAAKNLQSKNNENSLTLISNFNDNSPVKSPKISKNFEINDNKNNINDNNLVINKHFIAQDGEYGCGGNTMKNKILFL